MSERRKEGRKEAGRGERGERAFASASWRSRVRRPRSRLCLRVPTAAVEADAAASTAAFSPPGVSSIHRVLRCLSHNLRVAGIFVTKPRLLLTLKQRRASRSKATKKERERRKEGRSFWRRRSGEDRERKDTVRESRAGPTSGPRLPASWQLKKCVGGVAWRRLLIFDGAAGRTRSWPRPAAAAATLPPPLPNLPCLAAALPPHCT